MKILALYLPQFHQNKENDEWWGSGYTEWTNCKRAKSLKKGNYQPRIPLNGNYYNLLDKDIQEWQAELAKKYGIYGFCYYHYWFEGKLLLNRPMEQMINNHNIDLPFCISWANHSWASSPRKGEGKTFIYQTYGDREDWDNHFSYLLPFFKDYRYILIDNKPVVVIHNVADISCWSEMSQYWNELAKKNGFDGVYYVNTIKNIADIKLSDSLDFDAQFEFQPTMAMNNDVFHRFIWKIKRILYRDYLQKPSSFSYDSVWRQLLKTDYSMCKTKTYLGAYTDWDNTARWSNYGNFHFGASPQKFEKYMKRLVEKARQMESDYIFINAWNEWGEGAYLEPDEKFKYGYLEVIKKLEGVLDEGNS